MTEKYSRRIRQYLDDLQDERDDLFKNVTTLINIADKQVYQILKSEVLAEKETLQTFLRKILLVFSEVNNSVGKCLEDCPFLESVRAQVQDQTQTENDADLKDYLKEKYPSGDSFVILSEGPKLSNTQVFNESYIRKPLNDITLKVICSTILNNSQITIKNEEIVEDNGSEVACMNTNEMENESTKQQMNIVSNSCQVSPISSHRDKYDIAAVATDGAHPLMKFNPPTEIPKQYDTRDLDQIKENMMYFSKKMGFDSEDFSNLANQFDKSSEVSHYQAASGILVPFDRPAGINNEQLRADNSHDAHNTPQSENPMHLNNGATLQVDTLLNSAGPSASTGAIRKQIGTQRHPIDIPEDSAHHLSNADQSGLSSNLKVTSWLSNGQNYPDADAAMCIGPGNGNAIEKLGRIKRLDQHEEARNTARAKLPDLKFVEVKVPKVIKNNLNSLTSSASTSKASQPKTKVKDLNQERSLDEGPKVEVPTLDQGCVFTHIISPSEFYIQILTETHNRRMDVISFSLFDRYRDSRCIFSSKQNALATLGKLCCGLFSDSTEWFRFRVLDWKMDSACDEVDVQSLDYGFKCTLPYTALRELPSKIARIPALAVKCHLPFLCPAGSTNSHRLSEWPFEVADALYDIASISRNPAATNENPTIFVIVFVHPHNDSVAVDLGFFNELTLGVTLGMLLIDLELAKEIIDDYAGYEELGEFLDDVDELEQAENLNEFIWGFDANDEKRICRFTRKDGSCYKGKNCKLEHIMLKDGYTTDKSAIFYTAINDPEFPKKLETVVVSVTLYIDSCTYIVQVIRNLIKMNDSGIVMDQAVSELMNAINHPKKIIKFQHFKGYPSTGEISLALHPIANKWMRVRVNAVKKNFREVTIEVRSVDFGDHFTVNIKNIRVMQEEFMHLPFQSFQIYLDNYQHRAECDDSKARRFFNRHIGYRTFLAQIKNTMPPFKVSLTTFKGCEIGPTLVKEGFAEKRTIALDISDAEIKRGHFDAE